MSSNYNSVRKYLFSGPLLPPQLGGPQKGCKEAEDAAYMERTVCWRENIISVDF